MSRIIRSVAVLGAGTMGAQIAAHLVNGGFDVLLLDVTADAARAGRARARTLKPDPFFVGDTASRIRTAGFDDLTPLGGADWIIEAIVEDLAIKQALLARVDAARAAGAVVSSNTSGIPLHALAEGRSADFRRHWLGTHFFNPPRYLQLVELIPTADTDPAVTASMARLLDRRLGKGVVIARDSPGFIANHLGVFGLLRLADAVASGEYTIEEVDAITGPILGRPKSATFRTADIAGVDVLARVVADLGRRLAPGPEPGVFTAPPFLGAMVTAGLVGEKAGQGFYKKVKDDRAGDAGSKILTLDTRDPSALIYRDAIPPALPGLEAARAVADLGPRIRALFLANDRTGALLRRTLGPTLIYAARMAPDIAHAIDDVDRAMRWGFGWELGPFETWDAIGVRAVLEACQVTEPPPLVQAVLDAGRDRFRERSLPPPDPGQRWLSTRRASGGVVRASEGASLVDLGDGALAVEFHSKMNAIGGDGIAMLHAGVAEASANFRALVVGNEAPHFSAGANLMLLLLEAQEGNWDEVEMMVRAFQGATMALKTSPVPVIVAPAGLALGGGCEICLHGDRVQAAAETYMGLVEGGVGLIPAGGGTKELLVRAIDRAPGADPFAGVPAVFETIGFAKVSTSAAHARRLGYLGDADGVSMNRERLLAEAKTVALARADAGYVPPARRTAVPVGGDRIYATLALGVHLAERAGRISGHDALIGRKLAWILSGGDLPHPTTVSEDHLLDLEREAFLSLCGEPRTLERIAYTLKTGKTLRN